MTGCLWAYLALCRWWGFKFWSIFTVETLFTDPLPPPFKGPITFPYHYTGGLASTIVALGYKLHSNHSRRHNSNFLHPNRILACTDGKFSHTGAWVEAGHLHWGCSASFSGFPWGRRGFPIRNHHGICLRQQEGILETGSFISLKTQCWSLVLCAGCGKK